MLSQALSKGWAQEITQCKYLSVATRMWKGASGGRLHLQVSYKGNTMNRLAGNLALDICTKKGLLHCFLHHLVIHRSYTQLIWIMCQHISDTGVTGNLYTEMSMYTNTYILWLFMDDGSIEACGLWVQCQHQLWRQQLDNSRWNIIQLGLLLFFQTLTLCGSLTCFALKSASG